MRQNSLWEKEEKEAQLKRLEEQIAEKLKITDHEIREYPISVIVDKFTDGLEHDEAELFIPDYQREFVWTEKQQSRFIESLLMNLPIPYIFVSDTSPNNDGRLEIVDGSQRIRTLVAFLGDELQLSELKKIPAANGLYFSDFSKPRQLRFKRKTLRMIELTEQADEEARREIFDRLNSGGEPLKPIEKRFGTSDSKFYTFIQEMVRKYGSINGGLLYRLCPISESRIKRMEYAELLLRYFAYCDDYQYFDHRVDDFLDAYADKVGKKGFNADAYEKQLLEMLNFVNQVFPHGFRKSGRHTTTPRIRFEAIAVGVTLALRAQPNLSINQDISWLDSKEFITHTRSDASNSRPKVKARIEYVRDKLLK